MVLDWVQKKNSDHRYTVVWKTNHYKDEIMMYYID